MKTRLSLIIFTALLLNCLDAFSQPTITATGINPVLGESVNIYFGSYQSPGNAGANQTWDFTALAGSTGELNSCISSASTANASSFPNSNVALSSSPASMRYYRTTSAALENHGTWVGNVLTPFSDPEDLVRFPFTSGNSFTDTWSGTYTTSYQIFRKGTTSVTADAFGTITTPAGTFTNVLRVHFVQAYQDSFNFGAPFVITFNNDEYMWYQEGFHNQVATTFALTSSSGLNATGASYSSTGPVAMVNTTDLVASANLFPNPAADHMTLELELPLSQDVGVRVFNSLGQQVNAIEATKGNPGINRFEVAVDQLSEGIYFAKITVNGQTSSTKRFVVAR
jgi:Secretion system C-terminal sorting domain